MPKKPTPKGQVSPPRPPPVRAGLLRAYPRRPPTQREPSWYWQVVVHQDDGQKTVEGASGRYTEEGILKHLSGLVAQHGYDVPTSAGPKQVGTIDELIRRWLMEQAARVGRGRLSSEAYAVYYARSQVIQAGLGALHPSEAPGRAQAWLDGLPCSPRTQHNRASLLRAAWKWALKEELVDVPLPAFELRPVDTDTHVYNHTTPTPEQVVRVIADLPLPWQRLAADLLYDSGARVSEIVVVSPADVDLDREEITLRRKGRHGIKKIAHLPLSAAMTTRLRAWIADLPPGAATLFNVPAARQRLRYALIAACKRLGIPPFTPHGIRRLVSWRLIEAHTNRRLYQEIMGHSFEMGLSTYARATEESRRAIADLLSLRPPLYETPVQSKSPKT